MFKGKLIVLCGISNSGKSTFAATTVQHNPERYVRVNRDKIREMLYGYSEDNVHEYYHRNDLYKLENQVTEVEDSLIETLLSKNKSVIIDATHLKPKYLNRFDKFDAEKELIFFNITLKEALIRNSDRNRKVESKVIIGQYNAYVELREFLEKQKLKYDYVVQEINS